MNKKRIVYIELLRIISCFSVVLLHVCGQFFNDYSAESVQWKEINIIDSMTRWSVPVFVMISGAVLLGRKYSAEKIRKSILRFAGIYVVWALVYAIYEFACGSRLKDVFSTVVLGDTHMWFIPMIAGLYLLIPLLDKIVENKRLTEYFIALALFFAVIIPTIINALSEVNLFIGKTANTLLENIGLKFVAGYTLYFVLGKYLDSNEIGTKFRKFIYCVSLFGFVLTFGIPLLLSSDNNLVVWAYDNMSFNVFVQAVAIFILVKAVFNGKTINALYNEIALNSFGIYLVHLIIIKALSGFWDLRQAGVWTFAYILFSSVIVFIISNIIVSLIRRIPIIRKTV